MNKILKGILISSISSMMIGLVVFDIVIPSSYLIFTSLVAYAVGMVIGHSIFPRIHSPIGIVLFSVGVFVSGMAFSIAIATGMLRVEEAYLYIRGYIMGVVTLIAGAVLMMGGITIMRYPKKD